MLRPASAFNTFLPDTRTLMDKPKLLDRVHSVARLRHLSSGTERDYSDWVSGASSFSTAGHLPFEVEPEAGLLPRTTGCLERRNIEK